MILFKDDFWCLGWVILHYCPPNDPYQMDGLYKEAVRIVVMEGCASTSLIQRRLSIGYGRAAKLIDAMFHNNIVGPADGAQPREVLVGPDFLERLE
jgi:S-DNA-T family DNA segregation ATPase FtsK/SpoIIIE